VKISFCSQICACYLQALVDKRSRVTKFGNFSTLLSRCQRGLLLQRGMLVQRWSEHHTNHTTPHQTVCQMPRVSSVPSS